jgi:hypothetical protein
MRSYLSALLCAVCTTTLAAQSPAKIAGTFDAGQNVAGAVIGFGNLGNASASFGGRFEHAIKPLPDFGNGVLGFALDADFYHYSDAFGSGTSLTYIPVGASLNYHFHMDDGRWDPFLGAGLGYSIVNASGEGTSATASSAAYLITRAGFRYFYSSSMAFQLDAGAGAAALSLGIVWKM